MKLLANRLNPANFLGACGFLEIAGMVQAGVSSCWESDGLRIDTGDDAFDVVVSAIAAAEVQVEDANDKTAPFDLVLPTIGQTLRMDWWATRNGRSNSRWKCFGGQLKASGITTKLLTLIPPLVPSVSVGNLFNLGCPTSSRFGFDPRGGWNTLRAGFSPNEQNLEAQTYPFAEILSAVAVQTFPFPDKRGLEDWVYFTWEEYLPLMLARVAAADGLDGVSSDRYVFKAESRGQGYKCLTFSTVEK